MDHQTLLWSASKVWCPNVSEEYPLRVSDDVRVQNEVFNRVDLVTSLLKAGEADRDGYTSVYSFPRGHTDDGENIPEVNTIFIDFDIPRDSEYRSGNGTLKEWKRSMSDLLIRVQMVADAILDGGKEPHWRASLSGHKGVHLFFDFETVSTANGSNSQFKDGLKRYGQGMLEKLDDLSGGINIDPWVDVDSSDLARLVRHPNTPHPRAEQTDDTRWCVPVTIKELSTIDSETYLDLTDGPRKVPYEERTPSTEARKEIARMIRNSSGGSSTGPVGASRKDPQAVSQYKANSNDNIKVHHIPLLVTNKPCIMEFAERDDSFNYGEQSRTMEMNVMKELAKHQIPIDVIVDYFSTFEGFDEDYTRDLLKDVISRYDGPFTCKNIWDAGGEFCVEMNGSSKGCNVFDEIQATE
jgi:hypothetical protein